MQNNMTKACNIIKKGALTQVFSFESSKEILKEHFWTDMAQSESHFLIKKIIVIDGIFSILFNEALLYLFVCCVQLSKNR